MFYQTKLGTLFVAAILLSLLSAPAAADPPDILRKYRLIPRHSTLEVTGGFAGVDLNYDLFGRFGLVTGYDYSPLLVYPPILIPRADFVDVNVKALINHPAVDAAPVPLERFVDLEALDGTFRDPRRLSFVGEDNQGAPFRLSATIVGRLIHLTGKNDAPCCDFFNYKLDAYAHLAPFADFNFDGTVDSADYTAWRDHLGMTSGATLDQGDADGDGDVDQDDYAVLRQDFGMTIDMAALADTEGLSLSAVPEPSTLLTLMIGLVFLVTRVRQK